MIESAEIPPLVWVAVVAGVALTVSTVVRLVLLRGAKKDIAKKKLGSLKTWWVFTTVVISVALIGRFAAVPLMTGISIWSMVEFNRLAKEQTPNRILQSSLIMLTIANYLLILVDQLYLFAIFLPVVGLSVIGIVTALTEPTDRFQRRVGHHYYGLMLTTYSLSFVLLPFCLPAETNSVVGVAGWFLFLVATTETNDIGQALVGRRFGSHKIAPILSPNKTWEGFIGGQMIACLLAISLGHWLTPFNWQQLVIAAVLIAVAGFLGDLHMSAVKRAAHVKDSGDALPGQGGILDRVDSLTFTAPMFYFYLILILQPWPM